MNHLPLILISPSGVLWEKIRHFAFIRASDHKILGKMENVAIIIAKICVEFLIIIMDNA